MSDRRVPTGRLGRLAKLARVGARTGATLLRKQDATVSAEKTAEMLSQLRGLATKVGQMASYVDGLVPAEHRDAYEATMSKLQASATPSSAEDVRAILEEELEQPLEKLFKEWDETPIASASIGQVHRATTADGRRVAVKVQHPGIADALEADLRNATLLERSVRMFGMGKFESGRLLDEAKERFREELDYRLEAERQRAFTKIHEGDPKIHVPEVIDALSTGRVLTTELAEGMPFSEAREQPDALRREWAERLWRFVYKANLVDSLFNADPHPGNYLFRDDGSITFFDFGCVQEIEQNQHKHAVSMHSAANVGDRDTFLESTKGMLGTKPGSYEDLALAYVSESFRPLFESPFKIDVAYTTALVEKFKGLAMHVHQTKGDNYVPMPRGMLFINRLQFGFYSVLARLEVEADYASVERPFLPEARRRIGLSA